MDHFLKLLVDDCGLSQTQYWHLRLLGAISLVPLLGILYIVFFDKSERRTPPAPPSASVSLWVNSEGRLVALPSQQAPRYQEPRCH